MDKTSSSDDEIEAAQRSQHNGRVKGPSKKRFESIFSLGKRVKGDFARIIAQPGSGLVGLAIAKKIGSNPRRNKLKRRFREAIQGQSCVVNRQYDYVVVVHEAASTASIQRIEEEVRTLFTKVVNRWADELESS